VSSSSRVPGFGHGAIIAAGAVVTGDIPDFAVAAGIPARVVRMRRSAPDDQGASASA